MLAAAQICEVPTSSDASCKYPYYLLQGPEWLPLFWSHISRLCYAIINRLLISARIFSHACVLYGMVEFVISCPKGPSTSAVHTWVPKSGYSNLFKAQVATIEVHGPFRMAWSGPGVHEREALRRATLHLPGCWRGPLRCYLKGQKYPDAGFSGCLHEESNCGSD